MSVRLPSHHEADKYGRMLTHANAWTYVHAHTLLQGGAESSFDGAAQSYSLQIELYDGDYCHLVVGANVN